jgi:ABC-type transporter Mla subunit MlaD
LKLSNEAKVGLTVFLAALVAFIGFRLMRDLPVFRQAFEVVTYFDRVDGLNPGNVVYLNGIKVGSVKTMELTQESKIQVRLSIERDFVMPVGTVAHLTSISFIDGKSIVLILGDSDETVPFEGVIEGVYVDGVMEYLADKGEEIGEDLSAAFTQLNAFLENLNTVINDDSKRAIDETLGNASESTKIMLDLLEERQNELKSVILSASQAMAQLDTLATDSRPQIDAILNSLESSMAEMEVISEGLDKTMIQLNEILEKINNGEGTLGLMVNDPSLYNNLDSLTIELKNLAKGINENPGRYMRHLKLIEIF